MILTRIRRYAAVTLLLTSFIGLTGCPVGPAIVFFKDDVLEAAIREELSEPLGFLTYVDLLRLRRLDVRGLGVRNLSGLEFCTNLTYLDLSGNPISDITPLASLVNLLSLNIDGTDVFEISPLAGLLNLDSVSLCGTLVTNIQPLVTNSVNGGLGPSDFVNLSCASLSDQANDFDIPYLVSVGVDVFCCDGG